MWENSPNREEWFWGWGAVVHCGITGQGGVVLGGGVQQCIVGKLTSEWLRDTV